MGPLFLAFVLLPLADLWLLIRLGSALGGFNALAYTLAMGLLGSVLVRSEGQKVLVEFRRAQAEGRVPEEGLVGGLLILAGGLLLITPGVITDLLGFLCLLPPTRRAIAKALAAGFARKIAQGRVHVQVQDLGVAWPPRSPSSGPFGSASSTRIHNGRQSPQMPRQEDVIDTEGEEL
ncbi:MAG: hypothetical protein RLZZ450_2268 [Pseudomonadota bacterium]